MFCTTDNPNLDVYQHSIDVRCFPYNKKSYYIIAINFRSKLSMDVGDRHTWLQMEYNVM